MTANVTDTFPSDWKYLSEGGSSIVFSYIGLPHPMFDGTVLKLRKADIDVTNPEALDTYIEEDIEADDPSIAFQHRVIERLIPPEYFPHVESVHVERPWVEELARLTEEHRPLERRLDGQIDVNRRKAVLATDLVSGQGWTVEIKPKWGFLPNQTHLISKGVKGQTCRFCMHSHLKSTEGEDAALGYCPLDLYSGEEERVLRALNALWDVWIGSSGGVNNLRIFVEGHMLRPSTFPSSLTPLAQQVFSSAAAEPSLDTLRDRVTNLLLPLLLNTPLLRTLALHQRNLDILDIEGLSLLWNRAHLPLAAPSNTVIPPLGDGLSQPTIEDFEDFVTLYRGGHASMDHDHPDTANLRYYCLAYLLSASFKDCSIMLRIHPDATGAPVRSSIFVVDADVKSISRLRGWQKLDKKIVETYSGVSEPALCYDQFAKA